MGNAAPTTNLPIQATKFIGREAEAADVKRHLSATRLLTITGAGGCGKTRLSLEVAAEVSSKFSDGLWWVDLAPISNPAHVAKAVATVAGVAEIPNQPLLTTLARGIRDRTMLLILDNCEHVIGACAELVQTLLQSAGSVSILATSREPLSVNGEVTFRIPSMSFPSESSRITAETVKEYESVRLFFDRASSAQPHFQIDDATCRLVAEICRRLDGIPLAIELAAARVRVLTPQQIAGGLDGAFRVLTGGARTSVARQRTIEASIDWSYELLSAKERTLFCRLGVFAGGFTLDAVQRVCPGGGIDDADAMELLLELVDKSLVQMESGPRAGRYRLLETLRQFAAGRLLDSSEAPAVRNRHLSYMVRLAERAAIGLEGADQQMWIEEVDPDLDNIRAAFEWSIEQEDGAEGLRLVGALWPYWESRGVEEGVARLRAALARPTKDSSARAFALVAASLLCMTMADPVSALAFADEAIAISREIGDEKSLSRALSYLGIARNLLNLPGSPSAFNESVQIGRRIGDPYSVAESLLGDGFREHWGGAALRAREIFMEALVAANESGNPVLVARTNVFLGWVSFDLGDFVAANAYLERATNTVPHSRAGVWRNLSRALTAGVALFAGSSTARAEAGIAVAEANEILSPLGIAISSWVVGLAARAAGDADAASTALTEALPLQAAIGMVWLSVMGTAYAAELEVMRGDLSMARNLVDQGADLQRMRPNGVAEGRLMLARGALAFAELDLPATEDDVHAALRLFVEWSHPQGVVDSIERLVSLLAVLESFEEAARLAGAAGSMRRTLGYARFSSDAPAFDEAVARCREALGSEGAKAAVGEGEHLAMHEAVAYATRGRGSRKRPSAGWASLTPAELDVVRLVAEGLTNARIGERLFISPRTVQAHLSRVFGKLGVTSRTELAMEALKHPG